jgi:SAM-dependent methyltransferase
MSHGPDFYDDPVVFETYLAHRRNPENPNTTLEEPLFRELVGDVRSARIVDLGCGAADTGRWALDAGAAGYVGIEGSRRMVELARRTLAGTLGTVLKQDLAAWSPEPASTDLVVSRLALHYVEHLDGVLAAARRALASGGRLVISVEHPVITSCNRSYDHGGQRTDWTVDDYFTTGARQVRWMGGTLTKYHRTVEDYFSLVQQAGFVIDALRESRPARARFTRDEEYARRARIPLFLFIQARG